MLCKNFFSIPDFSKHFHIGDDELDTDTSEDEVSYETFMTDVDERREKKLRKLRKKSYKILPYFLNQNNELNENQLKTWKLFSSKFTTYKAVRQKKLDEQREADALKEQQKKKSVVLRPKSRRKTDPELRNWDFINDEREDKYFYVNRNRLDCEKIVYLKKSGQRLSDTESDTEVKKQVRQVESSKLNLLKQSSTSTEPDLSLSEDDEPEIKQQARSIARVFFYEKEPSRLERHFNYYQNLSPEVFNYVNNDPFLVTSLSLLMFNLSNRFKEIKKVLLAETSLDRLKWLSNALDLELRRR